MTTDSPFVFVGVQDGHWYVVRASHSTEARTELTAPDLRPESLAALLREVGCTRDSEIYASSTADFPEESGAPEGFKGRATIRAALKLIHEHARDDR